MIRKTKTFLAGFAASQWNQYTPIGQMLFILALGAMIVDAGISYQYGSSMTTLHAWGCALVAIGCAVFPDIAISEAAKKQFGNAAFFAAATLLIAPVAFQNHVGYSAGVRVGDINHVSAQRVVHEDTRSTVDEDKAALAMWTERLAKLEADKGWVASVSADGLRAQIDAADEAVKQEEKRGGCGPNCLRLKKKRAEIGERIASAEERDSITKQIAATKVKLDQARTQAASAKVDNSPVFNQTQVNGQLYNLLVARTSNEDAIKPTPVIMTVANILVAGGTSLAFMILAPAFYIGAGRNRRDPSKEPPAPAKSEKADTVVSKSNGQTTGQTTIIEKHIPQIYLTTPRYLAAKGAA